MKRSPTLEGFKAVFIQPSFGLAEIAWRWSLGLAGLSLVIFALIEYLDTLPVTTADALLLRTRQPALIGPAFEHILRGSELRLLEAGFVLSLAFVLAWVVVASLGRGATLKALLSYFVEPLSAQHVAVGETTKSWGLRSLVGLNCFRGAATLAAAVGCCGAVLLGNVVFPKDDASPGNALLVFLMVGALVSCSWLVVNWFLSLASVFVVADGEDTFGAMAAVASLCRERTGSVFAVSFWFGLAHAAALLFAGLAAIFLSWFLAVLPGAVVFCGVLLVALLYFAVADFLHIGRLGAYVYIARSLADPAIPRSVEPSPPEDLTSLPRDGRIDPEELILSDFPSPVVP